MKFITLICGYGVPEDILTDRSYHAYLTTCMNWLFDRCAKTSGAVVLNGGPTDIFKPYQRTEAGEMAKWIRRKQAEIERTRGEKLPWKIVAKPKSLSSVENILNFKPLTDETSNVIVFCERTRTARIRRLVKLIFGSRRVTIVPIDFDGSPRRYQPIRTKQSERDFIRMETAAVHNRHALKLIRSFMKKKLTLMREHDPVTAHRLLPKIIEDLHEEFKNSD